MKSKELQKGLIELQKWCIEHIVTLEFCNRPIKILDAKETLARIEKFAKDMKLNNT